VPFAAPVVRLVPRRVLHHANTNVPDILCAPVRDACFALYAPSVQSRTNPSC
jgi:hypothetical protein